jgi:type II restriction enzyme
MDLNLPTDLAGGLKSASQIARVVTEGWTQGNFYCVSCGMGLSAYPSGTKVYDFLSSDCLERFQLKASRRGFTSSALGADYESTREALMKDAFPSLILLHYNRARWSVEDLSVVHRSCITTSCIIPRKPLGEKAIRKGWKGYTIALKQIPEIGRIPIITQGLVREKPAVLAQWKRSESLLGVEPEARGWTADVLHCVETLFSTFTLDNVYAFEKELAAKHPDNHNVRAKIRQQLQILRDLGFVEFVTPGVYRYLRK